jgi:hypothetical protein
VHVLALTRLAGKRRLRAAPYGVTIVATDEAGDVSRPVRRSTRVR